MRELGPTIERFLASQAQLELLLPHWPRRDPSWSGQGGILPGTFNPLHAGHIGMWEAAERFLGCPVAFELSADNVDKPPLGAAQIARFADQFQHDMRLWLTRAATFAEKSALFPGATFVVGADTIIRIADTKYYDGQSRHRDAAIAAILAAGCRFLVAGRWLDGAFQTLNQLALPKSLQSVCDELSEADFRVDISSSELRPN